MKPKLWNDLPYGFRLRVSSMAAQPDVRLRKPVAWKAARPEYWKAVGAVGSPGESNEMLEENWKRTLAPKARPAAPGAMRAAIPEKYKLSQRRATEVLKRLFVLFKHYMTPLSDPTGELGSLPAVSLLSFGGRVNVRIPVSNDLYSLRDEVFTAIFGDEAARSEAGISTRTFATHGVDIDKNVDKMEKTSDVYGEFEFRREIPGKFEEKKGNWAGRKGTHYGMNIASGGIGEVAADGTTILPDGRHGHLYVHYRPPTHHRDGALLIGLESAKSGAVNPLGKAHDVRALSAEFTSVGGMKSRRPGGESALYMVDLAERKRRQGPELFWRKFNERMESAPAFTAERTVGLKAPIAKPRPPRREGLGSSDIAVPEGKKLALYEFESVRPGFFKKLFSFGRAKNKVMIKKKGEAGAGTIVTETDHTQAFKGQKIVGGKFADKMSTAFRKVVIGRAGYWVVNAEWFRMRIVSSLERRKIFESKVRKPENAREVALRLADDPSALGDSYLHMQGFWDSIGFSDHFYGGERASDVERSWKHVSERWKEAMKKGAGPPNDKLLEEKYNKAVPAYLHGLHGEPSDREITNGLVLPAVKEYHLAWTQAAARWWLENYVYV